MIKLLSAIDFLNVTMSEKTTARHWTNNAKTTHVLRFVHPWPNTPHGDIVLWLIYNSTAKTDRPIMNIFRSIERGFEAIGDKCFVFVDDYDPDAFYPVMEMSMFADGNMTTCSVDVTAYGGKCHIGFIVGQGFSCDFDEDGFFAVVTKILANYLPRDSVLSGAKKDLDIAMRELAKNGAGGQCVESLSRR